MERRGEERRGKPGFSRASMGTKVQIARADRIAAELQLILLGEELLHGEQRHGERGQRRGEVRIDVHSADRQRAWPLEGLDVSEGARQRIRREALEDQLIQIEHELERQHVFSRRGSSARLVSEGTQERRREREDGNA